MQRRSVMIAVFFTAFVIIVYLWRREKAAIEFPCSTLEDRVPEHADTIVTISELQPGAKLIFWVSEPGTVGLARIKSWQQASITNTNAGVATVSPAGVATINVRRPAIIANINGSHINENGPNVNWRICADGGGLGPVQRSPL